MKRTPLPGRCLIRRPAFEATEGGGRIALLDKTVRNWTIGQAELLAVGKPPVPDDDYDGPLDAEGTIPNDPRLVPGAWVMTRPRAWVATDVDGEYIILTSDILGVFA